MPTPAVILGTVALDRESDLPLHRQLFDALRQAILAGRLRPGTRLPSTRVMASDLGVARNTVMAAFEQLVAEGYLQARVGSGTTVTAIAPDMLLNIAAAPSDTYTMGPTELSLSARGRVLAGTVRGIPDPRRRAFQPGLPAFDEFPFGTWSRLLMRHSRRPSASLLGYGHTGGHPALRAAVADYLATSVTPHGVGNAARLDLFHVPRDESIYVGERVGTRNPVLRHRCQVEDRGRIADREVFRLRAKQRVRRRVALPLMPVIDRIERFHSLIERSLETALWNFNRSHAAFSRLRMARAALRPAAPLTPPPGWAPAPHKYNPSSGMRYW